VSPSGQNKNSGLAWMTSSAGMLALGGTLRELILAGNCSNYGGFYLDSKSELARGTGSKLFPNGTEVLAQKFVNHRACSQSLNPD